MQNSAQRFESIEQRLFASKQERQEKFSKQKYVAPHDFRIGDKCWYLNKSQFKTRAYEKDLHQVTKVAGSQITAKSLVTGKIVTRHSTHFKRYIDQISPPKLNLIDDDTNQTVENTSDDGMIYDDTMPAPLRNRIAGPNQPPPCAT